MRGFFRCVGQAIAEKGVAGLLVDLVPGGQYVLDIAGSAWQKWKAQRQHDDLRAEVAEMAAATVEQARDAAREVAQEVAADNPELAHNLERYLTQIPAAVRRSLARPEDRTGTTVPAGYAVRDADDVAQLLPPRLPRFRPGDAPAFLRGWVLEEQVGAGGFGEVWKGRNKRATSLTAAFKFGHGLSDRDLSLLHEGDVINRVMAAGRHPGIVALEDVWDDGAEVPWLRFEFVAGGDLTGLIHAWQALPTADRLAKALTALRGLAETVGHFHRLSPAIVHRDLKPSNILVDPATGRLKVADFGIGAVSARRLLDGDRTLGVSRAGYSQWTLRGSYTPLYASPQQRDPRHKPDPRDDVHALGVIAYQMLTGRLDRAPGRGFERLLTAAGAPAEFVRLVGDCIEEEPQYRPQDATELADALASLDLHDAGSNGAGFSSQETVATRLPAIPSMAKANQTNASYQIHVIPQYASYSSQSTQWISLHLDGKQMINHQETAIGGSLETKGELHIGDHSIELEYRHNRDSAPRFVDYKFRIDTPGHYRIILRGVCGSSGYFAGYSGDPEIVSTSAKRVL